MGAGYGSLPFFVCVKWDMVANENQRRAFILLSFVHGKKHQQYKGSGDTAGEQYERLFFNEMRKEAAELGVDTNTLTTAWEFGKLDAEWNIVAWAHGNAGVAKE